MKRLWILIVAAVITGGCADPLEKRTSEEVGGQFQRGISGQGRLIPSESVNNPTGRPTGAETPPDYPPP